MCYTNLSFSLQNNKLLRPKQQGKQVKISKSQTTKLNSQSVWLVHQNFKVGCTQLPSHNSRVFKTLKV